MTPARQLTYLGLLIAALTIIVKAAQVALEPQFCAATITLARGIISNVVVQAVAVTAALVGIVSLCAAVWDRAAK